MTFTTTYGIKLYELQDKKLNENPQKINVTRWTYYGHGLPLRLNDWALLCNSIDCDCKLFTHNCLCKKQYSLANKNKFHLYFLAIY